MQSPDYKLLPWDKKAGPAGSELKIELDSTVDHRFAYPNKTALRFRIGQHTLFCAIVVAKVKSYKVSFLPIVP